jgi:heavy metal efflux system protein
MAGQHVGSFYSDNWRYPIVLRIAEEHRNSLAQISNIPLALPDGGSITLSDIASLSQDTQVTTISHSNGKRYAGLSINLDGRDVQTVVQEAKTKIATQVTIPKGYTLDWGGQFENLHNARQKLMIIIPLTLLAIFVLVLGYLKNVQQTIIVLLSIPFAVTGGVFSLYLRGLPLTVSAGIGFIALMGIAILNALVLITFVNQLLDTGLPTTQAVHEGVLIRLKPVLSTALVASLGFIPMALNTGMGAEVQRPLATVVIGGLITSTLLTLVIMPQLIRLAERFRKLPSPRDERRINSLIRHT